MVLNTQYGFGADNSLSNTQREPISFLRHGSAAECSSSYGHPATKTKSMLIYVKRGNGLPKAMLSDPNQMFVTQCAVDSGSAHQISICEHACRTAKIWQAGRTLSPAALHLPFGLAYRTNQIGRDHPACFQGNAACKEFS